MAKKYPKLASILKRLLFERDIKPIDLARAVDLPPPTIHRLVTGKSTRPYESSLKPIADYFSIEVAQLLGEKPFSSDEQEYILEKKADSSEKSHISSVPLIPWNNLDNPESKESYDDVPFIGTISQDGFATIMPDTSMEPFIQRSSIIIFDPLIKPTDRSCILVKLHETKAHVLRQLLIDADNQYLKPLNPDLSTFQMRLLHKSDAVIACLVEIRFNFQGSGNPEIPRELRA